MQNINPKHNPEARRKMRGRWIGGVFVSPFLLKKAQEMRIERVKREVVRQAFEGLPFWVRWKLKIQFFLKNLWQKLKLRV